MKIKGEGKGTVKRKNSNWLKLTPIRASDRSHRDFESRVSMWTLENVASRPNEPMKNEKCPQESRLDESS